MKSVGLRELIVFLDAQTQASFLGSSVGDFLTEHYVELDDLLAFTRFREDTYARNLVQRTALYELFVLAWLPGQKACIHDHAGQRCWTTLHNGQLTFQEYAPYESEMLAPVPVGPAKVFSPGTLVYIDDDQAMHSIANHGKIPAVSLHLYAGPIARCRIFDESLKTFKLVELQCFPPPPEMEWHKERPPLLG